MYSQEGVVTRKGARGTGSMLGLGAVAKVHLKVAEAKRSLHCRRDRSHGESSRSAKQESNPGEVDELHLAQIKDDCVIGQATQLGFECVYVREVYVASHLDQTVTDLSVGLNVQLRRWREYSHPWLPFDVGLRSPRAEPCSKGTPLVPMPLFGPLRAIDREVARLTKTAPRIALSSRKRASGGPLSCPAGLAVGPPASGKARFEGRRRRKLVRERFADRGEIDE